jgi:hypothetical protein
MSYLVYTEALAGFDLAWQKLEFKPYLGVIAKNDGKWCIMMPLD